MEAKSKYSPNIKPYLKTHYILDSVDAYSNIEFNHNSVFPPIRIKTKPTIFILKRKQNIEYVPLRAKMKDIDNEDLEMMQDESNDDDENIDDMNLILDESSSEEIQEESEALKESGEQIEEILDVLYSGNAKDSEIFDNNESQNILNDVPHEKIVNLQEDPESLIEDLLEINEDQEEESPNSKIITTNQLNEIKDNKLKIDTQTKINEDKKTNSVKDEVNKVKAPKDANNFSQKAVNKESIDSKNKVETLPNRPQVYNKGNQNLQSKIINDNLKINNIKSTVNKVIKANQEIDSDLSKENSILKETQQIDKNVGIQIKDKQNVNSQQNTLNNKPKSINIKDAVKKLMQEKKNESKVKIEEQNDTILDKKVDSKQEILTKVTQEKKTSTKKMKITQKSLPDKDFTENDLNQKQKISNVKETIKNIIKQFKAFEHDFVSKDTEFLNSWLEDDKDTENKKALESNNEIQTETSTDLVAKEYKDPKESLKEILELFKELKKELIPDEDTIFDDIINSYSEMPISETLMIFNKELKNLMKLRKLKTSQPEVEDKTDMSQKLQAQKKIKEY